MMEHITRTVAKHYSVLPQLLFINSRKREYMVPKQMAMLLIRELTPYSYHRIGEYFRRNHAAVIHNEKVMKNEIDLVKERRIEYWELKNKLKVENSNNENLAVQYCHKMTYQIPA